VEDVDRDPVVLFDGLTKNWRYPGTEVYNSLKTKSSEEGGTMFAPC
jgi:hypothetical protein